MRRRVVAGSGHGGGPTVAVAQFNMLAAHLAIPKHFPYVPAHHLAWPRRRATLLHEMIHLGADVLCCQVFVISSQISSQPVQEVTYYSSFFKV